ncbi:hypothetical protein CL1_1606 [Thermococcus cleftensis]|uniref:Uncharacterized protein n=1 Tax=Thermococcus cleftensis (strain DSM 27260 / KACC 17922 / CL1) TaxID=163003 RepID=I3ZVR9_THECF|nr:hypothetical protein [Thermococcus cleftensis]AFL95803.1 hypothetical protein CL1_1606 [Thermococcus cleftensis]
MPVLWRDRLFWSLAIGGLLAHLSALWVGTEGTVVGNFLWIMAFVYLLISSIRRLLNPRNVF